MPVIAVNDSSLFYRSRGSGTPIIFVHPPLLDHSVFDYQMTRLSDSFQTVAFDVRGHGASFPGERPLTYSLIAEDMVALMDELGLERAFWCGYSQGSSVVLEALLNYPERCLGAVLVSGMSEASDALVRSLLRMSAGLSRFGARRLLAFAFAAGNAERPETLGELYTASRKANMSSAEQYFRCGLTYNCTAQLGRIGTPVLLLYGERDIRFKKYARLLQKGLSDATLHYLPNVSHQIPTKAASRMNGVVQCWVERQIGDDRDSDHPIPREINEPAPRFL